MTLAEYEKSQPAGMQKLEFDNFIVRAYIGTDGALRVMAHRRSPSEKRYEKFEELPLAYLTGTNYLMCPANKKEKK